MWHEARSQGVNVQVEKCEKGRRKENFLWKGTVKPINKACCVPLIDVDIVPFTQKIKIFYQVLVSFLSSANLRFHHPPLLFQRLSTTSTTCSPSVLYPIPFPSLVVSCSISQPLYFWCLNFLFYLMLSRCLQTCLSFPVLKRNHIPPDLPPLKQMSGLTSQVNFWKQWISMTGLRLHFPFNSHSLPLHWSPSQFTRFLFVTFVFDFSGELPSRLSSFTGCWHFPNFSPQFSPFKHSLCCLINNSFSSHFYAENFQISISKQIFWSLGYLPTHHSCLSGGRENTSAVAIFRAAFMVYALVPHWTCLPYLGNGPCTQRGKPEILTSSFPALIPHCSHLVSPFSSTASPAPLCFCFCPLPYPECRPSLFSIIAPCPNSLFLIYSLLPSPFRLSWIHFSELFSKNWNWSCHFFIFVGSLNTTG